MSKQINYTTRIQALQAMDTIMRGLNDEDLFMQWLTYGIEDACTDYDYYCDDQVFSDMLSEFCRIMKTATECKGALYIDNIVSN